MLAVVACSPAAEPIPLGGDRDGLILRADVTATGASVVVETLVRNDRAQPVHLVPDQCGRVIDVFLRRTRLQPEGRSWTGSLQAVKDLVLRDQDLRQRADPFHPRLVGDSSSTTPPCARPERPIALAPGDEIAERWELPLTAAYGLDAVGSDATAILIEVVEARAPDEPEFLDMLFFDPDDESRAGRNLRVELPAAEVLDREATRPEIGPSLGELYDRLLDNDALRSWIDEQPVDSWGQASLQEAFPGTTSTVTFKLVTTEFERAATVIAAPDGSAAEVRLPGEDARTREYARRPGTLPPGIGLIDEPDYRLGEDLLVGEVALPSGRVIVGEYLFDAEPLDFRVAPGRYPVHATLARYGDQESDSVSFATLVLSQAPTVRWEDAGGIAVDGGTTVITSVEGRDLLNQAGEEGEDEWLAQLEEIYDSLTAHDSLATEWDLTPQANLAMFSSGIGDGGYPVFVGYDAADRPTRVVVDFYLLHLAWPGF